MISATHKTYARHISYISDVSHQTQRTCDLRGNIQVGFSAVVYYKTFSC